MQHSRSFQNTLSIQISVGPEGEGIFMGATLVALLARRLKLPPREIKALSIVGASAEIAATYRVPLTAVAFALEIPYIIINYRGEWVSKKPYAITSQ